MADDFGFDLPLDTGGSSSPTDVIGTIGSIPGGSDFTPTLDQKGFMPWLGRLGTGISDAFSSDPFGSLLKTAQVGIGAGGLAAGIQGMRQGAQQTDVLNRAERRQEQVTAPAADFGQTMLAAGQTGLTTGQLPPVLESVVQDRMQKLKAQIQQYLASTGNADSTMAKQWETWLQQQEMTLRSQLAGELASQGLEGINIASGANVNIMKEAGARAANVTNLLGQANRALGTITAATSETDEQRRQRLAGGVPG